ncbi:hypothetical protein D9M70_641310 [compost metagenome]
MLGTVETSSTPLGSSSCCSRRLRYAGSATHRLYKIPTTPLLSLLPLALPALPCRFVFLSLFLSLPVATVATAAAVATIGAVATVPLTRRA